MLSRDYKFSFWSFDDNDMLLEETNEWTKGDSVGRNAFAYIFHPDQTWLKDSIMNCVRQRDDTLIQCYRYPGLGADTMSRDHVSAIILALYINRDKEELKWVLDNLPWKLSRKYNQTFDFWIWQKALKFPKLKWILSQAFYIIQIVLFLLILPWNFLLRFLIGITEYEPWQMGEVEIPEMPRWKRFIYRGIYPHFSLYNLCWQIRTMSSSFLQKILIELVKLECQNFVLKAILGREITKEEYASYIPINSFQWAGNLDSGIDREMRKLEEAEVRFNDLTKSNLDYFYFGIDKIMFNFKDEVIEKVKENKNLIFY